MFLKLKWMIYAIAIVIGYFGIDKAKMYMTDKYQDYQQAKAHKEELQEVINRSNIQLAQKNKQIEILSQDAKARQDEIEWARWRVQERDNVVSNLRKENAELNAILNSRVPDSTIGRVRQ